MKRDLFSLQYAGDMCSACACAAVAATSGTRVWLQTRHWPWLTRKRLRRATIALCVCGLLGSTVGLSSSTTRISPGADLSHAGTSQQQAPERS